MVRFWMALGLLTALQDVGGNGYVDPDQQDIPAAYRGNWALDAKFCADAAPAVVTIGARRIDFHERHGVLDLAQLNEARDPPVFHGSFRWAELLHFSTGAVRLEMVGDRLAITEGADPDAARNRMLWAKCP